jgi:5-methylcytosine-specific restriction protein A
MTLHVLVGTTADGDYIKTARRDTPVSWVVPKAAEVGDEVRLFVGKDFVGRGVVNSTPKPDNFRGRAVYRANLASVQRLPTAVPLSFVASRIRRAEWGFLRQFNKVSHTPAPAIAARLLQALDAYHERGRADDRPAESADTRENGRNPTWSRDELILALDLYLRTRPSPPGKTSREIAQLSRDLKALGQALGNIRNRKFRNPNGVYMKLMDFRRFDPDYTGRGLQQGGHDEEEVWREFASDPARCRRAADAIRAGISDPDSRFPSDLEVEDMEAAEGRILTRVHRTRERNRTLVAARKAAALKKRGRLVCEVCEFNFEERYGERGQGFIECHHTQPVHTLRPGQRTRASDLALVCSNCHRMIHAGRPWLAVEDLRKLLRT